MAAAGAVAVEYPEAAGAIAGAFAAAFSSRRPPSTVGAVAAGIGRDTFLPILPGAATLSWAMLVVVVLASALLVGTSLVVLNWTAARLYGHIRVVSRAADHVGDGSPGIVAELDAHGDVGELAERFNRMSRRVATMGTRIEGERQRLETLILDVSHQLKTPLASVKLMVELVLEGSAEGPKAREFLRRSVDEVERMEWLIRTLLTLARAEAGALPFHTMDSDLRETVEAAVEGVRELSTARGVRLDLASEAARIRHDSRWLAEAVANLVKNSAEHSPAGGCVAVTLSTTLALARVTVHDDGPGILAEELPRLFTRFYRGPGAAEEGTGIGLALAKAIVEGHGGSISVSSAPSSGTTFTVLLPRELTKP
jgi:signal transduction histidine kinase